MIDTLKNPKVSKACLHRVSMREDVNKWIRSQYEAFYTYILGYNKKRASSRRMNNISVCIR